MKEAPKPGFIARHRNVLLFALLLVTLAACSLSNQHRAERDAATVSLPLVQTSAAPDDAISVFRQQRDDTAAADMAALQKLVDQEDLDDQTRYDAAAQLQAIVDAREKQVALEGALVNSGMYPCVAVVSAGSVTIVTQKETLSDAETALLLTMAQVHAGADPSAVRVITGN